MSSSGSSNISAWQWFVKWAVLGLILLAIARTDLGHRLVYYALWLMVALLVVTHPQDIANVLNPTAGSVGPGTKKT